VGYRHVTLELGTCVSAATESMTITSIAPERIACRHLEALLARVGLGDEQFVDVRRQWFAVDRVQRVLRIDVGQIPPLRWASATTCRARSTC